MKAIIGWMPDMGTARAALTMEMAVTRKSRARGYPIMPKTTIQPKAMGERVLTSSRFRIRASPTTRIMPLSTVSGVAVGAHPNQYVATGEPACRKELEGD